MDTHPGSVPEHAVWEDIARALFRFGTMLLTHRRRIVRWAAAGGIVAVGIALLLPTKFTASVSFMPQAADPNAGLRNLAGQFGIQVGGTPAAQSPDFYVSLVTSPVILAPIASDSLVMVGAPGSGRVAIADMLGVKQDLPERRAEFAIDALRKIIEASVDKKTAVVGVHVTTRWRPVSLRIAEQVLVGVNDFNLKTRQSQASAERRFAEGRVALSQDELRASENRLQQFLERNRQTLGSPQLTFEKDRLQRDVSLHQQVVVTLTQALEDARLREVRDTPVITIVQPVSANFRADPGGRLNLVVLGTFAGTAVGVLLAFLAEGARQASAQRGEDARSFRMALKATLSDLRLTLRRKSRGHTPAE